MNCWNCVNTVFQGQRLSHRLGDAEINQLGHRLVAVQRDRNVRWFDAAMNDSLLVRALNV